MLPDPLDKTATLPWESDFEITPAQASYPGLSIVLPIFNAGKFLEKTIRSLLCNDLTGVEIIVMDGGSKDNTSAILAHYRDYFSVCVSAPDNGQSDAINRGFKKANQPLLYWLNGDDILLPNVLSPIRARFAEPDKPDVVVGDAFMTEVDFTPIRHFQFSSEKLKFDYLIDYAAHHLVQPSVFFSRKAWDQCGPVREDLHYAMDADLFLGMSARFEMVHLPMDVAYSVYHQDCKTRGKRAESITELALVQARHGGLVQTKKTLDLLVSMFNELSANSGSQQSSTAAQQSECPKCRTLEMKLDAIDQRVKKKMEWLLEMDLDAT